MNIKGIKSAIIIRKNENLDKILKTHQNSENLRKLAQKSVKSLRIQRKNKAKTYIKNVDSQKEKILIKKFYLFKIFFAVKENSNFGFNLFFTFFMKF